jgi:arylsulfatase A-like enzyme
MNSNFSRLAGLGGLLAATWFIGLLASQRAVAADSAKRPNILFLFTDDQRADTVGALGNPAIKTPAVDSLVERGFAFTSAYCLGGNMPAVCTPSRNMLLSGKAYFRWQGPLAPGEAPNFPLSFRDAGYQTYHHGKRGNTALNIQAQFEIHKYVDENVERTSGEPGRLVIDDAIAFLEDRRDERPFCMYLAFGNPHDPRIAAQKYLDLYEPRQIPLPKNYLPLHPFDNGDMTLRDERLAPWPRTELEIRRQLHEYYAVISGMDSHIGRLLETLRKLKLEENTLVVFSSDQGLAMGSHGLMGKQNLYEAGMKVPLVFAGPGVPHGRSDALVYLLDIYPTLCDLVGAKIPAGLDGASCAGVLAGKTQTARRELFFAYRDVQRALRDDRWKLIRYPQVDVTQLFDLRTDPDEIHDLAAGPAQSPRIKDMLARLAAEQKNFGDSLPLTIEHPKPAAWRPPPPESPKPGKKAQGAN